MSVGFWKGDSVGSQSVRILRKGGCYISRMGANDYRGLLPELVSSSVFRPSDLGTPTHGMSESIAFGPAKVPAMAVPLFWSASLADSYGLCKPHDAGIRDESPVRILEKDINRMGVIDYCGLLAKLVLSSSVLGLQI
jgi:hypothetical protein